VPCTLLQTTTEPANLSCQPCFWGAKATQMKPVQSGKNETKYAKKRISLCCSVKAKPVSALTTLTENSIFPGDERRRFQKQKKRLNR
jgi:hypothetical protein